MADEEGNGEGTLCGFGTDTEVACTARAGNSFGFGMYQTKTVYTAKAAQSTATENGRSCFYIFVIFNEFVSKVLPAILMSSTQPIG